MKQTCPACEGTGCNEFFSPIRCPRCEGKGTLAVPGGHATGTLEILVKVILDNGKPEATKEPNQITLNAAQFQDILRYLGYVDIVAKKAHQFQIPPKLSFEELQRRTGEIAEMLIPIRDGVKQTPVNETKKAIKISTVFDLLARQVTRTLEMLKVALTQTDNRNVQYSADNLSDMLITLAELKEEYEHDHLPD